MVGAAVGGDRALGHLDAIECAGQQLLAVRGGTAAHVARAPHVGAAGRGAAAPGVAALARLREDPADGEDHGRRPLASVLARECRSPTAKKDTRSLIAANLTFRLRWFIIL